MEILQNAMRSLGIEDSRERMERFRSYREMVLEWNEKINMTAIKEPLEFEVKHFVDSLLASPYPGFVKADTVIDIGTGAGFPGLPLAICFPEKTFVLVDSLKKRISVLNEIINTLGILNAAAIHGRAEDLAILKDHREVYDICLSRAVADLSVLAEYCLPFVRVGGFFGAYKSDNLVQELSAGTKALKTLGGRLETAAKVPVEGVKWNHQILWIKKIANTPAKYPRKAGIPSKQPIK